MGLLLIYDNERNRVRVPVYSLTHTHTLLVLLNTYKVFLL